jgi:hypothetical protein
MVSQSSLWQQYLAQLQSVVTLAPGEALQAVYPYQSWDWGGQSPIADSYSYQQWAALNVVPAAPYLNTTTSPATQSGFDTGYSNWMNTLAIGDLAGDAHYAALQGQVSAQASKVTNDYANAKNVWSNQTQGTTETFAAWLTDPANAGTAAQLGMDLNTLQGLTTELEQYQAEIQSPVQGILAAYNNSAYQTAVTDPNSGKTNQVRIWQTDPVTPWAHLTAILGGPFFGTDAKAGNAQSFALSASTETYDSSEYYGKGAAEAWDDFIGFEAEGSVSKIDWSKFDDSYSINFDFQDMTTVSVTPDGWYQGTDLTSYAAGPYATGFSGFKSGSDNYFFGVGGALSRIYTAMIVAYRPTVTISASQEFSTYLQTKWQAETGIMIGPFVFGGEASGEQTSSSVTVSNGTLTLKSTADWPVIIGQKSAWTVAPAAEEA